LGVEGAVDKKNDASASNSFSSSANFFFPQKLELTRNVTQLHEFFKSLLSFKTRREHDSAYFFRSVFP
jgi:hypothetical protein